MHGQPNIKSGQLYNNLYTKYEHQSSDWVCCLPQAGVQIKCMLAHWKPRVANDGEFKQLDIGVSVSYA
jgi:hypothetical protein